MSAGFLVSVGVYVQAADETPPDYLHPKSLPLGCRQSASPTPPNELEVPPHWFLAFDRTGQARPPITHYPPRTNSGDIISVVDADLSASGLRVWVADGRFWHDTKRLSRDHSPGFVNLAGTSNEDSIPSRFVSLTDSNRVPERLKQRWRPEPAFISIEHAAMEIYSITPAVYYAGPSKTIHWRPGPASVQNTDPIRDPALNISELGSWLFVSHQPRPDLKRPKPGKADAEFPVEFWQQAPQQLWAYSQTYGRPPRSGRNVDALSAQAASMRSVGAGTANPGSFEESLTINAQLGWMIQPARPWSKASRVALGASGSVGVYPTATYTVAGPYVVVAGQVNWVGSWAGEIRSQ